MNLTRETITASTLFKGLTEEQQDRIQHIARLMAYSRGEPIFWEGDAGNGFFIVATGMVKIFKVSAEGKEQILHIYGPGNPFGEVPVFAGANFPANAQAVEESQVLFIPRQAFIDLITDHPSLALNMLAVLSMRLRQFTVQIENLSLKEVPARLASYLIYLAEEQRRSDRVQLPVSKGHLASLLGTIPETLSRIFNKMSAQGYIEVRGAEIELLDRPALEALGAGDRLNAAGSNTTATLR